MATAAGFREAKIVLKDLKLWSENPRFPEAYFGKPENELVDYIVSVPIYKIKEFGKEIVEDFDMPIFEKLAIFDGDGEYVAYEGNRRLTVYKLLVDPTICSDNSIREYFEKLRRSINIDDSFKVDCVISNDKKEILRYVNRKHLNNNNEVDWATLELSNAKLRWLDNPEKIDILKRNISIIIRNLNIPTSDKDKILGRGYVTTLFRILNTRTAAKFFNLVFDNDNNLTAGDDNFLSKLEIIIYDILNNKTYNGKVFSRLKAVEIDEYLKSITIFKESKKEKESKEKESKDKKSEQKGSSTGDEKKPHEDTPKGKSGASDNPNKGKDRGKTSARKYLIPKECKLSIPDDKINNIYHELKNDLLLDDSLKAVPNAVGVLFRVFIEVTLDYYSEKKLGHNFKHDATISQKINFVVDKMTINGHPVKTFDNINLVGSSKKSHSYLSIEKFHQYVHSDTLEPSPSELKNKWTLLEPFFKLIWEDLAK